MKNIIFAILLPGVVLVCFLLNFLFVKTMNEEGKKQFTMATQARTTDMLLWQVYDACPGISLRAKSNYRKGQHTGFFQTSRIVNLHYAHAIRIALESLWSKVEIREMNYANSCFRKTCFNEGNEWNKSDKIKKSECASCLKQRRQIGCQDFICLRFKCSNPKEYLNASNYSKSPVFYYHDYIYKTIRDLKYTEMVLTKICPNNKYSIKKCDFEHQRIEIELCSYNLTRFQKQFILSKLLFSWSWVNMINDEKRNMITISMQNKHRSRL